MPPRKITVVLNPAAGSARDSDLRSRLAGTFRDLGVEAAVHAVEPRHIADLVAEEVRGAAPRSSPPAETAR